MLVQKGEPIGVKPTKIKSDNERIIELLTCIKDILVAVADHNLKPQKKR